MYKQINDIIKELKPLYPDLTTEQLEDIVKSKFHFIKEEIASKNFNNIKDPYLGKFYINKRGEKKKERVKQMSKAKEIFSGWVNNIFRLNTEVEIEARRRLEICKGCSLSLLAKDIIQKDKSKLQKLMPDTFFCSQFHFEKVEGKEVYGCGCPLDQKARSTDSKCPLNKWEQNVKGI